MRTQSKLIRAEEHSEMVMPSSYQFTKWDLSIAGKDYAKWWFMKVRDMNMVVDQSLTAQGRSNHSNPAPVELSTFRPSGKFAWIHINLDVQRLSVGDIDDCPFRPMSGHEIYVPSGWGVAVLKAVREFGLVSICDADDDKPRWGMRWNRERFDLIDTGYGWRK